MNRRRFIAAAAGLSVGAGVGHRSRRYELAAAGRECGYSGGRQHPSRHYRRRRRRSHGGGDFPYPVRLDVRERTPW